MSAIASASFRSITRSPSAVVFTLIFPLIFILVFGFIDGGSIRLVVGVSSDTDKNNPVFNSLMHNPAISLIIAEPDSIQQRMLQKGDIDALISIVKDNSGNNSFNTTLYTTEASGEKGIIIRSMVEHIVDKSNLEAAAIEKPVSNLIFTVSPGREYKTIDFILPGQLGFSLLSSGVFGTAFVFFNLRQTLVIKRFFATPVRKPYIILGEALSRLVFALLGAAFLICIGHFAFGFTLVHGIFTFMSMLGLSALGLIVFMGFGFVVSGLAKSESTIPPLANIITLPQFLLSGTFFSIENFPEWLQPVCKALPLTYLNDAMRKIAFEGATFSEIALPVSIVVLWGVVIYALANRVFRWE